MTLKFNFIKAILANYLVVSLVSEIAWVVILLGGFVVFALIISRFTYKRKNNVTKKKEANKVENKPKPSRTKSIKSTLLYAFFILLFLAQFIGLIIYGKSFERNGVVTDATVITKNYVAGNGDDTCSKYRIMLRYTFADQSFEKEISISKIKGKSIHEGDVLKIVVKPNNPSSMLPVDLYFDVVE